MNEIAAVVDRQGVELAALELNVKSLSWHDAAVLEVQLPAGVEASGIVERDHDGVDGKTLAGCDSPKVACITIARPATMSTMNVTESKFSAAKSTRIAREP